MSITVEQLRLSARDEIIELHSKLSSRIARGQVQREDVDVVRDRLLEQVAKTRMHDDILRLMVYSDQAFRFSSALHSKSKFDPHSLMQAIDEIRSNAQGSDERMNRVDAIMDRYDEALRELAK